jgi:DMSO/TMAO reductase YedYZ molybdopterin-dependent catalytic subunit
MIRGGLSLAALAAMDLPLSVFAQGNPEGAEVVPFLTPHTVSPNRRMVHWDQLKSWVTPNEDVFTVAHYGSPKIEPEKWQLELSGLFKKTKTLTLADLKKRPKKEIMATIECSGNGSSPTFMGAVGNAKWGGTPLGPLLKECGLKPEAVEIAFCGADEKTEKIKDYELPVNFSRGLSISQAMRGDLILAYEMNGELLPQAHGGPVRLIVPGWYGVAWVKWLTRIEAQAHRVQSRFMARDYVTIRGEEKDGRTIWRETQVSTMNVKSMVARVVRLKNGPLRITGAAWTDGTPLKTVDIKIDDGPWLTTKLDTKQKSKFSWTFWSYDWYGAKEGEHTLVSRATDANDRVQPAATEPAIKLKKTYYEANQQVVRKIRV